MIDLVARHTWMLLNPIIAVDFDGPLNTRPDSIGALTKDAFKYISKLYKEGAIFVLWTCRTGETLEDALEFLQRENLTQFFIGVNSNIPGIWFKTSSKMFANFYVDDSVVNGFPGWEPTYLYVHETLTQFKKAIGDLPPQSSTLLGPGLALLQYNVGTPNVQKLELLGGTNELSFEDCKNNNEINPCCSDDIPVGISNSIRFNSFEGADGDPSPIERLKNYLIRQRNFR